jgi:hypothetical protein
MNFNPLPLLHLRLSLFFFHKKTCNHSHAQTLSPHRQRITQRQPKTKMKSAKQIYKEVKAIASEAEQQKYINALTEKETMDFFNYLLRFP